jgi:hypothetical protein
MHLRRESRFAAPPETVGAIFCSEALQLPAEREREGVAETSFVVTESTEECLVFELRSREYKRTLTGGLDRSATIASRTRNVWDRGAGTIRWSYESGNSERVTIEGVYRLVPDGPNGGATRMAQEISVDVRIPLVGARVAKYILGEMEKSMAQQDRRIETLLAERHA